MNAFQSAHGGSGVTYEDGFIAKFDTTKIGAASKLFATYFGGDYHDIIEDVAVDTAGNIHIVGYSLLDPQLPAGGSLLDDVLSNAAVRREVQSDGDDADLLVVLRRHDQRSEPQRGDHECAGPHLHRGLYQQRHRSVRRRPAAIRW